jgi:serine/threonine protein phosphatase PrpC
MEISFEYITDKGKVRAHNEDSYGIEESTPNGKVYVVCDGMGGHVGGATASNLAVTSILEYFRKEAYDNIFVAIDKALQFANEQIYVHTLAEPSLKGMGTTAVVLVIKNDDCYIGHVGDSRIYLKTENKLHRITKDHSFVQNLVDAGVITDDQAESHPQKNQILRALGHGSEVKGTVSSAVIKVQKGDVFMLCSDGLNGMIHDSIMEEMIDPDNLEVSKLNLLNAAMENGGLDNITLVLVKVLSSSHYKHSVFESFNPGKPKSSDKINEKHAETNLFPENTATSKPKPKKGNKLAIIIASVSIVLCLCVFLFFKDTILGGKEGVSENGGVKSYTKNELEGKTYQQLEDIKNDKGIILGDVSEVKINNKIYDLELNPDNTIKEIKEVKSGGDVAISTNDGTKINDGKTTRDKVNANTQVTTQNPNPTTNPAETDTEKKLKKIFNYDPASKFYKFQAEADVMKITKFVEKLNKKIKDSTGLNSVIETEDIKNWNPQLKMLDAQKNESKDNKIYLPKAAWVNFRLKNQ